jgi:hypothetical protein
MASKIAARLRTLRDGSLKGTAFKGASVVIVIFGENVQDDLRGFARPLSCCRHLEVDLGLFFIYR